MVLEITRLSGVLGAEIVNIDIADLDEADFASIRHALIDYGVICIRDQHLSPDTLLEFARRWGDVHRHPYLRGLDDRPEIIEIVKEPEDTAGFGDHWHTDQIFTPEPAMATMLYAREVPTVGGDTMFACLHQAFESLSGGMQTMLCRLRTCNRYDKGATRSARMQGRIPLPDQPAETVVHPLVRVHPETGRRGLYLTDTRTTRCIDGMSEAESRPLLDWLLRHATQPALTCRLAWRPGTLGIWDNRRLLHMALNDYTGQRRVMHRITIRGARPLGVEHEIRGRPPGKSGTEEGINHEL